MASHSSEVVYSNDKRPDDNNPSPTDFELFLPWACGQLQLPCAPRINRCTLTDLARTNTTRGKAKDDVTVTDSQSGSHLNNATMYTSSAISTAVYIDAVYDTSDNLVQLKFKQNINVPESLLKIISLIVQFHPFLTAIYIHKGLNQSGLYQVSKTVAASNITDIILDDTVLKQANYYLLLEENCSLKYLSLARCMLNDTAVKELATKLEYPSKASKNLSVLNLSSNRITDMGAKYLGDTLRINRRLSYLNLSGNMISDIGADSILSSLITFRLTSDEIRLKKARNFNYMNEKKKVISEIVEKMRIDFEKKYASKKKGNKTTNTPKTTKSVDVSGDTDLMSVGAFDSVWLEKAQAAAEEAVGQFQDPFNVENTISRGEVLYCYGNNALCYLNLAYNDLTYFSVQQLHNVISIQQAWDRRPNGLVNVCIEGNNLPRTCKELAEIDYLLETGLTNNTSAITKKKITTRGK